MIGGCDALCKRIVTSNPLSTPMLTPRRSLACIAASLAVLLTARADIQLDLSALGVVRQSADASISTPATQAIDGNTATFSQTTSVPNSFWEAELTRKVRVS